METKRLGYVLVMLCLVLSALFATPSKADCTGDLCGCDVAEAACEAACMNPDGCGCEIKAVHCSVCCCCDGSCPPYCG
jgi:hypothetical protein